MFFIVPPPFNRSGVDRLAHLGDAGGADIAFVFVRGESGNLDTAAKVTLHKATPLKNSLNPSDAWQDPVDVPQRHFVGSVDKNMPPVVAKSFQDKFPADKQPEVEIVEGFDHHCCWVNGWPTLYPQP